MLIQEIRRQFGAPSSVRYLRSLPNLQVDTSVPDQLNRLLSKMDEAETKTLIKRV